MASTYKVKKGDTLSQIAETYLGDWRKYKYLASINNISNPNLIYVGQIIKLSGSSSSSSSSTSSGSSKVVTIDQFGIQSDSDNTIFATWSWSTSNTDHYEVEWYYDTGDGVWFVGQQSQEKNKQSTWSIPSNAKSVRFRVKPISTTKKDSKGNESYYWSASWSAYKTWNTSDNPPKTPPVPTVEVTDLNLTATLENLDVNGTEIEFQVARDNTTIYKTGKATIDSTNHASYSCALISGSEYKVRCRTIKGSAKSEWSDYSSNYKTEPSAVTLKVCKANKRDSDGALYIYLEWTASKTATAYEVEYTTDKSFFDNPSGSTTTLTVDNGQTKLETFGLETGHEYFFRVRAKNTTGESDWSDILSVPLGEVPAAPTTWSSTTTATVGGPLTFYWVHNAKDGSSQTWAELYVEVYVNDTLESHFTKIIENTHDPEEIDKTSYYDIDTSVYSEGAQLRWRVRTSGVTEALGEWSIVRMVDIYAEPVLELTITDSEGNTYQNGASIEAIKAFPIKVHGIASPATQAPIGYHLNIVSNAVYDTVDNIGNDKTVNEGEVVYSKYFDIFTALDTEIAASDVDLENNINYTINCVVAMNSGLSASASVDFTVFWTEQSYDPNAIISIDNDTLVAYIRPYCEEYTTNYYTVTYDDVTDTYTSTTEIADIGWGEAIDAVTTTGEIVYSGISAVTVAEDGTITGGEDIYYCEIQTSSLVNDITLSVYRREFDGSFVELATGLDNSKNTFITDPHPALDYARYRIVAVSNATGAVSFYDVPGYPVGGKSIIIQWDEQWSTFDTTEDAQLEQPPWAGSMLQLPYNIDVSDKYDMDVSLIEYVGRKRPVTYYGTQLGETSTWNVDIPKNDEDTLYALRRLAIWPGDVYVREPSGSGYWANISVAFSQTHLEMIIPVTLDITRVEGGA